MQIRHATSLDIPSILAVFEKAKKIMRNSGNMHQWAGSYPDVSILLEDMKLNEAYVFIEDNIIHGYFTGRTGDDPTYGYVEGGSWLNDESYITIHRIASDGILHNLLAEAVSYLSNVTNNIKIDTHKDNAIMQHVVKKLGFQYCGIIYLLNGDERLAYQLKIR